MTYKIIRFKRNGTQKVIYRGMSLENAKLHCNSPMTHKVDKQGNIVWFDGYTEE